MILTYHSTPATTTVLRCSDSHFEDSDKPKILWSDGVQFGAFFTTSVSQDQDFTVSLRLQGSREGRRSPILAPIDLVCRRHQDLVIGGILRSK